jgi:hypothetical protein
MSMRAKSLALGICLLARVTFGGDAIASFAQQSLGLDLASIPFGTVIPTNDVYGATSAPLSPSPMLEIAEVSWMTNAASDKYNHDFTNRVLRFGVRDGRLAAVRISIHSFIPQASQEIFDQRRKELVKIQDELIKANRSEKANPDARYSMHSGAMCSPSPESLFLLEIQITPVEKKTTSPASLDHS